MKNIERKKGTVEEIKETITVIKLVCNSCKHSWTPRTSNPTVCPKCNMQIIKIITIEDKKEPLSLEQFIQICKESKERLSSPK
jgi:Zn finger protein HypA/HybF involved in hydrogenase expression